MKRSNLYSYRKLCYFLIIWVAIGFIGCGVKTGVVKTETTAVINTGAPPLTPITDRKTIFFDDFSDPQRINRNMWISNGQRHWIWQGKTSEEPGCVDGCLKQNNEYKDSGNVIMYVQTPQFSNGTIETKTRISFDQSIAPKLEELDTLRYKIGAGIVFRMHDADNYYMFRLAGEEGCVLGKMVNGKWFDLKNPRRFNFLEGGRIKPNYWYALKVKVIGNNFECFINDSPVINYTDYGSLGGAAITIGHIGLVTFKCFADFEYINVYQ